MHYKVRIGHFKANYCLGSNPLVDAGPPTTSSFWSWLPEECKGLVLRHLDSKDLAKAARTSKEFAEHIRTVRAGLGVLNVPPGKPYLTCLLPR